MKLRIGYLAAAALTFGVFLATPVVAIAETENTNDDTSQSTSNSSQGSGSSGSSSDDSNETPEQEIKRLYEVEDKKGTQASRVKERVALFKVKLTAQEQLKLKAKCVEAQGNVVKLESKVDVGVSSRSKAYDELLSHLDKLITKLKEKSVDTTKLEAQRKELAAKIDTFKADLAKYKLALNDLRSLGCVNDPEGFKASLEAARAARKQVATDAAGIRAYVKDTIKPELVRIKQTLSSTDDSSSSSSSEQGGAQ